MVQSSSCPRRVMRTRGSSVATLLLLLIYLTTDLGRANGRSIKWGRSVPTSAQQTAPKENNDNPKEVQRRSIVPVVLDLQVDQSELMVINMDDLKGVDDIKDAISAIGYEPQKVNTKKKRRAENYSDSQVSSSHATLTASPEVDLLYYEVPKSKKTIVTPQYPSKASFESVQKPNATDLEYVYPISPIRQTKQRFSKYQSLIPTPPDEPRSDTPVIPKVLGQRRSFSPLEPPRPRPFATAELTTPPTQSVPSTITSRRGKSRSKVRQPVSSRSETSRNDETNNYPVVDPSKTVGTIRNESRRKARRLVAKPDNAQSQLSKSTTVRASREGSLEKSMDGGGALTRRDNNRNHWTSLKGEPNSLSEETESSKSPVTLNKRLYERKKQGPSVQVIPNNPPVVTERTGPVEFHSSKVDTPVTYTTSRPVAREESSVRPVQFDHAPVEAARILSVTPSGLDGYQNIESPVVTVHSSSLASTIAPFTSTIAPFAYSSNSVLYSLQTSTAGSVKDYKVSTPSPWTATEKYRDALVDGVAEATSSGSTEEVEIKDRKEDRKENRYQRQSDNGGSKGYSEELNTDSSEEKGDDVDGADTHVSLHKDERHPDEKGGAGHDNDAGATGGGVAGENFEKGGDEERLQGHKEEEGEKGEKGYKSRHEHEKANKGHHDKETQTNYYDESEGKEKKHDDEGGYHEERQQGEKGQKESEYDEKGEHQKGHSTKGQHTVHKKDEFEKYTEFFDDYHEDGEEEEDAEFHRDHEMKKGGSHKNSHHDFADDEEKYGKETTFEKGKEFELTKGHKEDEGQDDYRNHEAAYGEKVSHEAKKNRAYSSGDDGNGKAGKKSH